MNQNDMDHYYWRTGHSWGGGPRAHEALLRHRWSRLRSRTIGFLFVAFIVTLATLFLLR